MLKGFIIFWLLLLSSSSFSQNTSKRDSSVVLPPHTLERAKVYLDKKQLDEALMVSIFMAKSKNLEEAIEIVHRVKEDSSDQYIISKMETAFYSYVGILPNRSFVPTTINILNYDDYDWYKDQLIAEVTENGKQAFDLHAGAVQHMAFGRIESAEVDLKKANELIPNALRYIHLGQIYETTRDRYNALTCYTNAILLHKHPVHYFMRGVLNEKMNKYQNAIADMNQVIDQNFSPLLSKAFFKRGSSESFTDNFETAIQDFTKSIEIDINFEAYGGRALVYGEMKETRKAKKDLDIMLEIAPEEDLTHYYHGLFYLFGRFKPKKAITHLNKAILLNPNSGASYYYRGEAYRRRKKYQEACRDYRKGAELGSESAKEKLKLCGN